MSIQSNIQRLDELNQAIRNHCMCARISDNGCLIEVIYPSGDWPLGIQGIQASYGVYMGKADAIQKLLDRMESDWLNSFPGKI